MVAGNQLNNDEGGDDDVFVYTGGEQEVPRDVKRLRIAENIDTIPNNAFADCPQLIEVEGHDKLKKIEKGAFLRCRSLRRVKNMNGIKEIEKDAFLGCHALSDLDFDKLEIIGGGSFCHCKSLRSINMPSVRRVGVCAFFNCTSLMDAVFGEDLEGIERGAFDNCAALRRIAIPLKHGLIVEDRAFTFCESLVRVDSLLGGIHKTISSLHLESWRNEMREAIDEINQTLPDLFEIAGAINRWIESVLRRMEYYKEEHRMVVEEAMMILELALWKAKLLDEEGRKCEAEEKNKSKKARIDIESTRKEHRVTCGANIVIKNVLPFLALK